MESKIKHNEHHNKNLYSDDNKEIAYRFASKVYKEFGNLIKAIVLFGSTVRTDEKNELNKDMKKSDIDVLIIIDDITIQLTPEVIQTYRIIIKKLTYETSDKLHVTSLKFTSFWDLVKEGDPIAINMLRYGLPLIDSNFFYPLQLLLKTGRIYPSEESIWIYYNKAPKALVESNNKLLGSVMDLYWAVMDASHAALMKLKVIPPSPDHIADMVYYYLASKKLIDMKYVKTVDKFFRIAKKITYKQLTTITGKQYDSLKKEAQRYVDVIRKFISKDLLNKKIKESKHKHNKK